MSRRPWFKFYPGDWMGDLALQSCSIEARGLMIEIMCKLHEGEPYGTLRVKGRVIPTLKGLLQIGVNPDLGETLLQELIDAGCLSLDNDGGLYSPRMVRDGELHEISKKYGKRGGNPVLDKSGLRVGVKGRVNPPPYPPPLSLPLSSEVRSQKSEYKGENPLTPPLKGRVNPGVKGEMSTPEIYSDEEDQGDITEGQALAQDHAKWRRAIDPTWKGMSDFILRYGPAYQSLINRGLIDPTETRGILAWAKSREFWRSKLLTPEAMMREKDGVTWLESARAEMGTGEESNGSHAKALKRGSRPANADEAMRELELEARS